jgi:hypothetical protein
MPRLKETPSLTELTNEMHSKALQVRELCKVTIATDWVTIDEYLERIVELAKEIQNGKPQGQ